MTIYHMISTLDQLTKGSLQQFDLDPWGELNLTDEQHREMNGEGRALMIDHAEQTLREAFPEADITIDGLGEIHADINAIIDEETWEAAVEAIQYGPDYDEIIDHYIEISAHNNTTN